MDKSNNIAKMEAYSSVDYHTAGEPFRIVTALPIAIEGIDVPAKRIFAMNSPEIEKIRKLLCHEPRGHADMYGGFVVEPNDAGADFGVLFWHKDGFSTACGHGSIALGVWAVESGLKAVDPSGVTEVVIDVPSGRVKARVHVSPGGSVDEVDFINVASFVMSKHVPVHTTRGEVNADISFGGAIYAQLNAASVGLSVTAENVDEILAIGREVKWGLNDSEHAVHPEDSRLSGIYGTIVYEDLSDETTIRQRNATIFADGELDRSPCGSGTCARVATLTEQGTLPKHATLVHESIVNSRFHAAVIETTQVGGCSAIIPRVTGVAYQTGKHTFVVDPRDDLVPGFVLR